MSRSCRSSRPKKAQVKRLTAMDIVLKEYPAAYEAFRILGNPMRIGRGILITVGLTTIGRGMTASKAWADAARRLRK